MAVADESDQPSKVQLSPPVSGLVATLDLLHGDSGFQLVLHFSSHPHLLLPITFSFRKKCNPRSCCHTVLPDPGLAYTITLYGAHPSPSFRAAHLRHDADHKLTFKETKETPVLDDTFRIDTSWSVHVKLAFRSLC